eukprot:4550792-Lingulodinium_polyedra.AAC.1
MLGFPAEAKGAVPAGVGPGSPMVALLIVSAAVASSEHDPLVSPTVVAAAVEDGERSPIAAEAADT